MTTKAVQLTEMTDEEYNKAPEGIDRIEVVIPGVGTQVTFWQKSFVDDLDEKITDDVETVKFTVPVWVEPDEDDEESEGFWRDSHRTIDLGKKNRDAFFRAIDKYLKASEEVTAPVRVAAKKSTSGSPNPALTEWRRRVRTWLNESPDTPVKKNEEVPKRGVLKAAWEAAYVEAHPEDPQPTD